MNYDTIKIDEVEFRSKGGEPITKFGVLSDRELAGIKVELRVVGKSNIAMFDNLVRKKQVSVQDPFADSEYIAKINLTSTMHQEGLDEKKFSFTVMQIDKYPDVKEIEINQEVFKILKYKERIEEKESKSLHALLKTTPQQNITLNKMFDDSTVIVKRVGFDEEGVEYRFGGAMYWSEHSSDDSNYFKRIVRFYPKEIETSKPIVANPHIQSALAHRAFVLTIAIERLLDELIEEGVIKKERKDKILSGNALREIPNEKYFELEQSLYKVFDAEDEV